MLEAVEADRKQSNKDRYERTAVKPCSQGVWYWLHDSWATGERRDTFLTSDG